MKATLIQLILLLLALSAVGSSANNGNSESLFGTVIDESGDPVIGATVLVAWHDSTVSFVSTNIDGAFSVTIPFSPDSTALTISAVGYEKQSVIVPPLTADNDTITVQLAQSAVYVGAIEVKPAADRSSTDVRFGARTITRRAEISPISNNPVSAVKQAQLARQGSSYSSKLRVNGTNPTYFLNDIAIGSDPNHFGMFSIIPASVVESIEFLPGGTSAPYELPVALNLKTPAPFNKHFNGDFDFSFIQTTGTVSFGNDRFFTLASLRKSVLDKLVKYLDVSSDRKTLPPTNFQDVFVSSGLKLSPTYRLMIDHYYSRDYLAFNTDATADNPDGIYTFQHINEQFIGARLQAVYSRALVRAELGRKESSEQYKAYNPDDTSRSMYINMAESAATHLGKLEMTLVMGPTEITTGGQAEYVSGRTTTMTQAHWNFQPPEATSDNPFVYQAELDDLYGRFYKQSNELSSAAYLSILNRFQRIEIESGLRYQQFSHLADSRSLLWRQRIAVNWGEHSRLNLFAGNFAENPVKRVLEPYQILVRANLDNLKPTKTWFTSLVFSNRGLKLGVFAKRVKDLPVATPNFEAVTADGIADNFITAQPNGEIRFYGGDIAIELDNLWLSKFRLYSFYGYTHAEKITNGIHTPYELNAPHKFYAEFTYRLSKTVTLGSELAVRSGYAYTPALSSSAYLVEDRYNEVYYGSMMALENSQTFRTNASLSLSASFNFGDKEVYLSVNNATNRSNPIINTSDGFIYDAGILPSLGFKWRF